MQEDLKDSAKESMTEEDFIISEDEFEEKKKWLFKENIRLEELRKNLEQQQENLEEEKKVVDIQKQMLERQKRHSALLKEQLDNQKRLFDRQWQILERETRQLAIDREKFKRDKLIYRDEVYREARRNLTYKKEANMFFKGVQDNVSLKKRYKALLKIYHPDNLNGDKEILQAISAEYESLSRSYLP